LNKACRQEDKIKQVINLLEKRGRKALEMAKNIILKEEIECSEVREVLKYFITEYCHDIVRPAILSLCCEAVGGDPEVTIPIAISMIFTSGGLDIHDDIIDKSKIKRSRPTVLGKFGENMALIAGDFLIFKGLTFLQEAAKKGIPPEKIQVIYNITKKGFFKLGEVEALELRFRKKIDVTPDEYIQLIRKKAADAEAYTRISAIAGNGSKKEIEALGKYGQLLGMIFLLRDDTTDMMDLKELSNRIKKEYLPLPILFALQNQKIKNKLIPLLLNKTLTKKTIRKIVEITKDAGGFKRLENVLQKLAEDTYRIISNLKHEKKNLQLLVQAALSPFK
jgi:geranylgeranyl diphosphate synthase type I